MLEKVGDGSFAVSTFRLRCFSPLFCTCAMRTRPVIDSGRGTLSAVKEAYLLRFLAAVAELPHLGNTRERRSRIKLQRK
jgi:hypothetical protein